jgi:Tfp pilus assembly protein PilX
MKTPIKTSNFTHHFKDDSGIIVIVALVLLVTLTLLGVTANGILASR